MLKCVSAAFRGKGSRKLAEPKVDTACAGEATPHSSPTWSMPRPPSSCSINVFNMAPALLSLGARAPNHLADVWGVLPHKARGGGPLGRNRGPAHSGTSQTRTVLQPGLDPSPVAPSNMGTCGQKERLAGRPPLGG